MNQKYQYVTSIHVCLMIYITNNIDSYYLSNDRIHDKRQIIRKKKILVAAHFKGTKEKLWHTIKKNIFESVREFNIHF